MNGRQRSKASNGFALIAVLWFLVLIAAIGSYLLANARSETALARNIRASANAEAMADAGVADAVFNQTDPVPAARWPLDGEPHTIRFNGGEIAVRLYDERAKVNPNLASDALLGGLFQTLGIERSRARRLGAAMADWVSSGGKPRPFGAKLEQYRAAGKTYGPPNAPIETLDEIVLVLGMTPEVAALIRPYLTLYTDEDAPAPALAGPLVKRALAIAAREERAADSESAQPASMPQAGFDPDAPSVQAPAAAQTNTAAAKPKSDVPIVALNIVARSADGGVFVREAVIRIDPSAPKGYAVLAWRRGDLPD